MQCSQDASAMTIMLMIEKHFTIGAESCNFPSLDLKGESDMTECVTPSASSCVRGTLMPRVFLGLIMTVLLLCASCATVGHNFPAARVSDIRIGETTQDQIREMFGDPWRVGIEDGQRTWTYGKYRYRAFKEASTQDLVVRFDERNRVASYTYNTTEQQD